MSKYIAEQVIHAADLEQAKYDGDLIISGYLRDYAALLRERESAKAVVTDEIVYRACKTGRITRDEPPEHELAAMRRKLEAVAPMLASARVPDELESAPASPLHPLWGDGYLRGWNACRKAMLAAAPKPETEE